MMKFLLYFFLCLMLSISVLSASTPGRGDVNFIVRETTLPPTTDIVFLIDVADVAGPVGPVANLTAPNDTSVELGAQFNFSLFSSTDSICVDIDHPSYGVNFTCGVGTLNVSYNITFYRTTTFEGNASMVGPSNETINIQSHQYDTPDALTITLLGYESDGTHPKNVKVYLNGTVVATIQELFNGSIETTTFEDETTNKNATFNSSSTYVINFNLPKFINTTNALLNLTGYQKEITLLGTTSSNFAVGAADGVWINQSFFPGDTIHAIEFGQSFNALTIVRLMKNDTTLIENFIGQGTKRFNLTSPYTPDGDEELRMYIEAGVGGDTFNILTTSSPFHIPATAHSAFDPFGDLYLPFNVYGQSYPKNVTLDIGELDGSFEFNLTGNLSSVNSVSNFSTSLNTHLGLCAEDAQDICTVPIYVSSIDVGVVELRDLSILYSFSQDGVVSISSETVKDFLNSSTGAVTIPVTIDNPGNGSINITSMEYDFAGGNRTTDVTIHGVNITTLEFDIYNVFSNFEFSLPLHIFFLEFIPSTPTSKDVQPFGQNANRGILNVTSLNYNDSITNISMLINETFSCVNLTVSKDNNKTNGTQLSTASTGISWYTPTAYYKLDSNVNDASTNGYDLAGKVPSFAAGKLNEGADFEVDDQENLNYNGSDGQLHGVTTFDFWYKAETVVSNAVIFGMHDRSNSVPTRLTVQHEGGVGQLRFRYSINSSMQFEIDSVSTCTAGNWCNIIGRVGENDSELIINGVSQGKDASTDRIVAEMDTISLCNRANAAYCDGIIDNVFLTASNYTVADINTSYNSGDGEIFGVTSAWADVFNFNYQETKEIYMWADYACNQTFWRAWQPDLYIRPCCSSCVCSEEIV